METIKTSLDKVLDYCQHHDWEGYDPFDGLNSRLFRFLPLIKKNAALRLIFLQLNKRSPFNFRPLLLVRKGKNPKGIGLFLTAALRMYRKTKETKYKELAEKFLSWLEENASSGYSGKCWGYNFDWQSRAFYLPAGTPTVVNTSFIGRAFCEAYEVLGQEEFLEVARSACEFVLQDLNREEGDASFCFSYSPKDRYFVHNATALASSLFAQTFRSTGEVKLATAAKRSMQYVIDHQTPDGAWFYGENEVAQKTGIDNFHTGFILESLKIYTEATRDQEYWENIQKGLAFYEKNFFLDDGRPKYFPDSIYPIDIHCAAQGIITLIQLQDWGASKEMCEKIAHWMIENMQHDSGFFYYQKGRFFTNKISYMRWTQAWALYALATYFSTDA
jgi:rhamnogalacturonyl hydrolase YesR